MQTTLNPFEQDQLRPSLTADFEGRPEVAMIEGRVGVVRAAFDIMTAIEVMLDKAGEALEEAIADGVLEPSLTQRQMFTSSARVEAPVANEVARQVPSSLETAAKVVDSVKLSPEELQRLEQLDRAAMTQEERLAAARAKTADAAKTGVQVLTSTGMQL